VFDHPFDVDGVAVVFLDDHDDGGDRPGLLVVQGGRLPEPGRCFDLHDPAEAVVETRHERLVGDVAAQHPAVLLVKLDPIRRDRPLHERLAEPPRRLDDDTVALAAHRIDREGHPGAAGVDELQHSDGHREIVEGQPTARPVEDRAGAEQAGPTPPHGRHDLLGAGHPQIRLELPGAAGLSGVLAGGRAADRHRNLHPAAPVGQFLIGAGDRLGHLLVQRRPFDQLPEGLAG
jgi:hypothetical protein